MPIVETTVFIQAPVEKVYAIARDNRSFPEFMEDVQKIDVLEESNDRVVSEWTGTVPVFKRIVRWTQEDVWTEDTCVFRQVKGDYDKLEGTWKFLPEGEGTRFNSVVDYEYVVPGLGPLIKKVVHALVIKNMDGVLGAIKKRAEEN